MSRFATITSLWIFSLLLLAGPALAKEGNDNGEGLLGETNDKIVTFFSLGVVVFFVLVIVLGSAAQAALEKRKERRKAARLRSRTGW